MVAKSKLTQEQKDQLIIDKKNGVSDQELMTRYNISKMTIYNNIKKVHNETESNIDDIKEINDNYLDNIYDNNEKNEIVEPKHDEPKHDEHYESNIEDPEIKDLVGELFGKDKPRKTVKFKEEKETKTKQSPKKEKETPTKKGDPLPIIMKIQNYCKAFPDKIEEIRPVNTDAKFHKYMMQLSKMTYEEVIKELDIIRLSIGRFSSYNGIKLGYLSLVDVIEKGGCRSGFDIEGFKKDIEDNDQIDVILKELSCEYSFDRYLDPKLRLLAYTGFQIASTYKKNKIIKSQRDIINNIKGKNIVVDDSVVNKYKDI